MITHVHRAPDQNFSIQHQKQGCALDLQINNKLKLAVLVTSTFKKYLEGLAKVNKFVWCVVSQQN